MSSIPIRVIRLRHSCQSLQKLLIRQLHNVIIRRLRLSHRCRWGDGMHHLPLALNYVCMLKKTFHVILVQRQASKSSSPDSVSTPEVSSSGATSADTRAFGSMLEKTNTATRQRKHAHSIWIHTDTLIRGQGKQTNLHWTFRFIPPPPHLHRPPSGKSAWENSYRPGAV